VHFSVSFPSPRRPVLSGFFPGSACIFVRFRVRFALAVVVHSGFCFARVFPFRDYRDGGFLSDCRLPFFSVTFAVGFLPWVLIWRDCVDLFVAVGLAS